MHTETFNFKTKIFKWTGDKASWFFAALPVPMAEDINNIFSDVKRGWGSLPVKVTIGESVWTTSIFPDKKSGTFILPIKAKIRKDESIKENDELLIEIELSR